MERDQHVRTYNAALHYDDLLKEATFDEDEPAGVIRTTSISSSEIFLLQYFDFLSHFGFDRCLRGDLLVIGVSDGFAVGMALGTLVGAIVGTYVGVVVGAEDGQAVGLSEGSDDGAKVSGENTSTLRIL